MPDAMNAVITAVSSYLPEDKLTNEDLEKMVDTSDEWIMTRVGIKERRILNKPHEGASYLATQAVLRLLEKSGVDPLTIEGIILATNTADYHFPSTASIVAYNTGCKNAFTFDLVSACPSWLYALETGANYIRTGRYKRLIVVATEKMSAAVDKADRSTIPLFGDGSGAALLEAVLRLLEKSGVDPLTIEGIILATNTADYHFPSTASIVAYNTGCKNAFTFDLVSACPSWLYALETGANYIRTGRYKRLIVVATEKMSAAVDKADRSTIPLFGDGSGAALLEASKEEGIGVQDALFRTDGVGKEHLIMLSGGSVSPATAETVARREHFVLQDGQHVFKYAIRGMVDCCKKVMQRNGLTNEDINWVVPHQANRRIIDMVASLLNVNEKKVMINIEKYGNTSSATIPICLAEWEPQLKKGDKLILTSFGAGYTYGSVYLVWGYDGAAAQNK